MSVISPLPFTFPTESFPYKHKQVGMKPVPYFTPHDVSLHNSENDIWLSWLGNVYNITNLLKQYPGSPLIKPLIKHAGEDVSHWFEPKTGQIKSHMSGILPIMVPFTPNGMFIDIPPPHPRDDYDITTSENPWWQQHSKYWIGILGKNTRKIKIFNTLTDHDVVLQVCSEEVLSSIQERYLAHNAHAKGYMWKRLGNLLDMTGTLDDNDIPNQEDIFDRLGMDSDEFIPVIHLFFSDDLTVA